VLRANIGAMRLPEQLDDAVALVRHAIDADIGALESKGKVGRGCWENFLVHPSG